MITTWLKDNLKPQSNITDIGCGDGALSKWMPEYKWIGIDINAENTAYKGTRLTHDLEVTPYPLPEASQEAVVCSEVLEHLFTPEKVHQEAKRILKPRGIYIVSTPNFDWIEHHLGAFRQVLFQPGALHTREHIRFYNYETHRQMLDNDGFEIVDICGADVQFSEFFKPAREYLNKIMPGRFIGEIDYHLGRMFPTTQHTIGILAVKR